MPKGKKSSSVAPEKYWIKAYKNVEYPDLTVGAFFVYGGGLSTQFNCVSVDMEALSSGVCLCAATLPVASDVFVSAVQPDSADSFIDPAAADQYLSSDFGEKLSSHAYLATENGVRHYIIRQLDERPAPPEKQYISCYEAADASLDDYSGVAVYSFDRYVANSNWLCAGVGDHDISAEIPDSFSRLAKNDQEQGDDPELDEGGSEYWGVWYGDGAPSGARLSGFSLV